MLILVTYDVETLTKDGQKRLRHVAKACMNYGQRVQNSVFECLIDEAHYVILKNEITGIINPKLDSIRFYILGNNWNRRVIILGKTTSYNVEDLII